MGGIEGPGGAFQEVGGFFWFQRPALGEILLEIEAIDVAHGDEQCTGLFPRLEYRDHVGMVDRGRRLGLAYEPRPKCVICGPRGRKHFERHLPLETLVLGAIDVAHPAATNQGLDSISGEFSSGLERCQTKSS